MHVTLPKIFETYAFDFGVDFETILNNCKDFFDLTDVTNPLSAAGIKAAAMHKSSAFKLNFAKFSCESQERLVLVTEVTSSPRGAGDLDEKSSPVAAASDNNIY
jgi:hypothetical protein